MEKLPSKPVVDAVIESKSEIIIASDVATRAGVSLSQARKDLTTLASLSQGDISVSKDGELLYEFPNNLNSVLASNSAKYKARQSFEKAWPVVFTGIRVGFGVALVASIALVFSAIMVLQSQGESSDDRRDNRRGGGMSPFGGGFGGMWGPSPFDFFYYRPYGSYGYYGKGNDVKDPEEMGFLESAFSFVFGDGDPNAGLEEKRLSLAAQMIRDNKGAVTAEQLAPYCDAPDLPDDSSSYVDESFVLPIVSQLDGMPTVTEDGDIIYTFPDLQVSASTDIQNLFRMNESESELMDPSVLQERDYKFSVAPATYKFFAGALGVVNLGGVLYLGNLFNQYDLYGVRLPSFLGVAQTLYPALVAYAVLFISIPVARNFWISSQNAKIQGRNKARRRWKELAKSGGGTVLRKLKAAAKFATNRKLLKGEDTIFDTNQSVDVLVEKKEKFDLDEFDKLLNDDQNTFQ
ncbi:hypothetical protein FRACYDRAFT_223203 [Fragilariopsis cylindrus CCMP1102]|uniref:Uncharacterized protein n=1 Tax=Fragilariopsis cylindrus CCMP1102 TaxID=635003 RepID=A0A1E7FUT7_9STRA|nr:hypothetical protein FRACYDRAFT_223203 [Fragilariopsis cylindrus CCMP1102]|eukprot:OEU21920.1 hypothetical protein FRACYDRAFT_223203 [Fragilariopsis cylindrus CCMP1102]